MILFALGVLFWFMNIDTEYHFFSYEMLSKKQYLQCHKLKYKIAVYKKMFAGGFCYRIAMISGMTAGLCLLLFLMSMIIKWQTSDNYFPASKTSREKKALL